MQFALVRKVLRIGKFVEHIRAASEIYDASNKGGDKVTQYLQLLRQIGYAGYLFLDTTTVLDALGVQKSVTAKNRQLLAYKFWFTGLVASASAGIYTHYKLQARVKATNEKEAEGKVERLALAKYGTSTHNCDFH